MEKDFAYMSNHELWNAIASMYLNCFGEEEFNLVQMNYFQVIVEPFRKCPKCFDCDENTLYPNFQKINTEGIKLIEKRVNDYKSLPKKRINLERKRYITYYQICFPGSITDPFIVGKLFTAIKMWCISKEIQPESFEEQLKIAKGLVNAYQNKQEKIKTRKIVEE